jgi:hypothetical protein
VKFSINRYNAGETTTVVSGFNPLRSTTSAAIAWTDLNLDKIAQGQRTWNPITAGRREMIFAGNARELLKLPPQAAARASA